MAERAHPDDTNYCGSRFEQALCERYQACRPFIAGKRVLDVPCGTGWGTSMLEGTAGLYGIDIDKDSIDFAKSRFPGIQFVCGSMTSLPFEDGSFDVIVCLEGLEHIYLSDAEKFLSEARRVLKDDGLIILTAPLLKAGQHSQNPYHMFEFEETQLKALLTSAFSEESFEHLQGPDGPEVRFRGRKASPAANGFVPRLSKSFRTTVSGWLTSLKEQDGFRFSAHSSNSLLSTCFAINIYEGLNSLSDIDPFREKIVVRIKSAQDSDTGVFVDPLQKQIPLESELHDKNYLDLQTTYFCSHALSALGETPAPFLFMKAYYPEDAVENWLAGLNWGNPWLESNRVMFLLSAAVFNAEKHGDDAARTLVHRVLDWLDLHQERDSGLWGVAKGASLLNAVAGAYHFLPFYEYLRRPFRAVNRIIDQTLSLQFEDGLFAPVRGGGACEDLDAIDILAVCAMHSRHRESEVKRALIRAFWAIWNMQLDSGAFPYARRSDSSSYRFSSWSAAEAGTGEGDSWATWFRLCALHTIKAIYPDDLPEIGEWVFRREPALGYHRFDNGLNDTERSRLKPWLRIPEVRTDLSNGRTSVIIPFYNLGAYLPETLASLAAQSRPAREVILVDDGSNDQLSLLYLEVLLERGQIKIIRKPNAGLGAARNTGIKAASGDYIVCLDSDDCLHADFIRDAEKELDASSSTGIVSCWYSCFDNSFDQVHPETASLPAMMIDNSLVVSAMFRRKDWELAGAYNEKMTGLHDWSFWLSILELGRDAVILKKEYFSYRVRAGSMYSVSSQPENFGRLYRQIVETHPQLFNRHLPELMELYSSRLLQLGQGNNWISARLQNLTNRLTDFDNKILDLQRELQKSYEWTRELQTGKDWLEQQWKTYQGLAANYQSLASHLQTEVDNLKTSDLWQINTLLQAHPNRLVNVAKALKLAARCGLKLLRRKQVL